MASASASFNSFKAYYDIANAAKEKGDDKAAMVSFLEAIKRFDSKCDQQYGELFLESLYIILGDANKIEGTHLPTRLAKKDYQAFLEKAQPCFEAIPVPGDDVLFIMDDLYRNAIASPNFNTENSDSKQIKQQIVKIKASISFYKKYHSRNPFFDAELLTKLTQLGDCFRYLKEYSQALTCYGEVSELLNGYLTSILPLHSVVRIQVLENILNLSQCYECLHQLDEAHRCYSWIIDFLFTQTKANFNVDEFYKVFNWFHEIYRNLRDLVKYEPRYQDLFTFAYGSIFMDQSIPMTGLIIEAEFADRADAFFKIYDKIFSEVSQDRRLAYYLVQFMTVVDYFYSSISVDQEAFLSTLDKEDEDFNQIMAYIDRFIRFLSPAEFKLFKAKLAELNGVVETLRTIIDCHRSVTTALVLHVTGLKNQVATLTKQNAMQKEELDQTKQAFAALEERMAQLERMVSEHKRKPDGEHPDAPSAKRPAPMRFLSRSR